MGCHEHKHRAPTAPAANPAALRRPASSISPEPQGSRPFNYAGLVQPVLVRHCVACHVEKKALDLSGLPGKYFTRSYESLTDRKMTRNGSALGGGTEGSRTLAGKYGARGSKLLALLDKGHHDVKLPPEDLRRITLWMDCNSDFFGAYHDIEAQLKGDLIKPALE